MLTVVPSGCVTLRGVGSAGMAMRVVARLQNSRSRGIRFFMDGVVGFSFFFWGAAGTVQRRAGVARLAYPTSLPGRTGRSVVMTLSVPSLLTAERIMPSLTRPFLKVRGAKLAMKHTCLPMRSSGS